MRYHISVANLNYTTVSEHLSSAELGDYHTYGIRVTSGSETRTVHDISTRRETVDRMAALFNRHRLRPVHLMEVIEDMLP